MRTEYFNIPLSIIENTAARLALWEKNDFSSRLWEKDPTIWKEDPKDHVELADRLGWLDLPYSMKKQLNNFISFAEEVKDEFTHVLLLGMGGSSLCPEVFSKTFGSKSGYPTLSIVDSTHPQVISDIEKEIDFARTLFIVASKSGGTVETMSFYYRFYGALQNITDQPGKHFVALTDPNTSLEKLAIDNKFRRIFHTPADVGGRYSAITPFGLLPAALMGIDISVLLSTSELMADLCGKDITVKENPGMYLGALLGELSLIGIDKLPFFASPKISSFPQWVEQLVAESTGKEGKGILPIADEPKTGVDNYGKDRFFIFLRLEADDNLELDLHIQKIKSSGFPLLIISLRNEFHLGAEFFRWELATVFSGVVLGINPFDQPDVQLAKTLANEGLAEFQKTGKLPYSKPSSVYGNIEVFDEQNSDSLNGAFANFFSTFADGDYVALLCFLPYQKEINDALMLLRKTIFEKYKITVAIGYGPRFLHSTGQLHKGGANNGRFIQITDSIINDLEVPNKGYTFGTLITAQALGDLKALQNRSRKTLRLNLADKVVDSLKQIIDSV